MKVIIEQVLAVEATPEVLYAITNARVVARKGYNAPATYVESDESPILNVIKDENLTLQDNEEKFGEHLKERLDAETKKREQANTDLEKEKLFWKLRNKAHAMHLTDEDLRAQLMKATYVYNFEPKAKED